MERAITVFGEDGAAVALRWLPEPAGARRRLRVPAGSYRSRQVPGVPRCGRCQKQVVRCAPPAAPPLRRVAIGNSWHPSRQLRPRARGDLCHRLSVLCRGPTCEFRRERRYLSYTYSDTTPTPTAGRALFRVRRPRSLLRRFTRCRYPAHGLIPERGGLAGESGQPHHVHPPAARRNETTVHSSCAAWKCPRSQLERTCRGLCGLRGGGALATSTPNRCLSSASPNHRSKSSSAQPDSTTSSR